MADLVARGPNPQDQWRRKPPADPVTLGRTHSRSDWDAPWDRLISSLHAELQCLQGQLRVRRLPSGRNPIFYRGQALDEFTVNVGETFVIGQTTFQLEEQTRTPSTDAPPRDTTLENDLPVPNLEMSLSTQELRRIKFTDADRRIEVLAALPEMIRFSPSDAELEKRVVDVLLQGIPHADAAAIIRLKPSPKEHDTALEIRVADSRAGRREPLMPSRRLASDAIQRRRQSVLYRWDIKDRRPDFTVPSAFDWALCVPLPDDPTPGWGLYVAGSLTNDLRADPEPEQPEYLKGDLKFTELVAHVFGALRQVRDLQQRNAQFASILSRPVLAALAMADMEVVLKPRETQVTVLFCDLRGSSRISEEGQDNLPALWDKVSAALGIMTSSIVDEDGVIGDFQGDAAMGFWGWPMDVSDSVERGARAALKIRRGFARASREKDHPLAGFACGLGLAHGPAMAGKLGTQDQFKVGVFGPVVNLASRLESMTKMFQVPILLDERTAQRLNTPANTVWCRCRKLACVQPYGMRTVLTVSELLPPMVELGAMPERDRRDYEAAFEAFQSGHWQDARDLLRRLSNDGPAEFLKSFMERHQNQPPRNWNGVIVLDAK